MVWGGFWVAVNELRVAPGRVKSPPIMVGAGRGVKVVVVVTVVVDTEIERG
jgi:hypothetical protein